MQLSKVIEERKEPEKWHMQTQYIGGIKLNRDDDILYEVGDHEGYVEIHKIGQKESKCILLGNVYKGMSDRDLNGTNWIRKQKFIVNRIVALQFK